MLFRELFIDAIAHELRDVEYRLIGDRFYIYKCETGIVCSFSFDVIMNGSDFYIFGGAASFCDKIEMLPSRQLLLYGYDVSSYAARCGLKSFSNVNYGADVYQRKRYTKAQIIKAIENNMAVFRETLLPDILNIASLEDYYNLRVKGDGFGYYVPVPFPSVSSFYLCISLEKFREASHVYLQMLRRNDEGVGEIDRHMHLPTRNHVIEALDKLYEARPVFADSFERLDREAKIIEDILLEHKEYLAEQLQRRISASRETCDVFFV